MAKRHVKKIKWPKPKVKSKQIKTKYTGPGPRQVITAAVARRNREENKSENYEYISADGSSSKKSSTKRRRRIATY